ncbi:MAG: succinylglutamate desuccinylase/aspartoacylase family protein [Phycisphaerales bacterium]|nr:MAG: succinylglutamate desuccinylase/aspartoacylase family protein [Phycisphaerales bacterium]
MATGKSQGVPQKVRYSFLKILTGSDLSRRRLPFMSVESAEQGPVVWLAGCIHGDEVTGIVTIQEVFKRIQKQHLLRGSVYAFPLMNPIGFETGSRNITLSREDLNRSFPGRANGSLAERIAEKIFATITETNPDLVLDLHNDWMKSIPYVVVEPSPGGGHQKAYKQAATIAGKAGFLVILETEQVSSSFANSLLRHGVPALTIELGESYVVNEQNVAYGVDSILAILAHLDMVEQPGEAFSFDLPAAVSGKMLEFSSQPVGSASGIIRFLAGPGDLVKKGQPVAKIYNAFGKLQDTVVCLSDGIVLGHSDSSVAFPGAPIMAFGIIQ